MAKKYDPIMCMMVDKPDKAQDAKSLGKYKLPNGEIVDVIDRKNVHGVDTIVYKNSGGVHFATVGWFMSNAKKVYDSASVLDKAIKTADGATGDKLYADVKAIYSLFSNILLTYSNEQSVQKLANEGTKKCLELAAKVKGVRDEAIKACDAVEVETSKWSFSSGKSKPSGFGNWWFKIGTEEKNFSGNWSSAKAEAIKYAKEKGINRISLMT